MGDMTQLVVALLRTWAGRPPAGRGPQALRGDSCGRLFSLIVQAWATRTPTAPGDDRGNLFLVKEL